MSTVNKPSGTPAETRDLALINKEDGGQQLQSGTILEKRYQIDSVLGVGGMGAVYRARDLRFRVAKYVAVKEIIAQVSDNAHHDVLVENFVREANIIASLNHHAIPKIYDYFTLGMRSYLVMEFIQGENIEKILDKMQELFPVEQVITWAIELCGVLEHLHKQEPDPIIFRDIKPANIIITPDQRVALVDFGIAKEFQTGHKGTIIGTEGYSPPEQYRGESSPLVDIYALGATLHHMLSGIDPRNEPPFTFAERPIHQFNPEVSIELENVVNTALQYNTEDRFPNAAAMKAALLPLARTATNTYRPRASSEFQQVFTIEPVWIFKCQDEIRASAKYYNGNIYVGTYDNNLYAINAVTGTFIWKYPTDGGIVSTPNFHSDNIFIGSEDHRLHAISEHTGGVLWTYYTGGPVRSSPTISDNHIFIGSDDNHLHIVNAKSGRGAVKFNAGAPIQSTPLVNEEVIYFGTQNGDFFCINFRGQILWRASARRAITSSARLQNDIIYFGALDSIFYALNAKTGKSLWRFRMDRGTISTPAITGEHVFIGSADGNIYCIDLQSKKKVWQYKTANQVSSSPVIYNGALYCGSVDGKLYCLDSQSGQLRWKYETGGAITGTPTILDDVLYIGSTDKNIYALPI